MEEVSGLMYHGKDGRPETAVLGVGRGAEVAAWQIWPQDLIGCHPESNLPTDAAHQSEGSIVTVTSPPCDLLAA